MQKYFYVYLIATKRSNKLISYVGFTNNLSNRMKLHNSGKGAKFTRGNNWDLLFKKKFKTRSEAMKNEHKLKKNYSLRKKIKENYYSHG